MKKTKKKWNQIFSMVLVCVLVCGLAGCGKKNEIDGTVSGVSFGQAGQQELSKTDGEAGGLTDQTGASDGMGDGQTGGDTSGQSADNGNGTAAPETAPAETEPPIIFTDVEETVYAAERLNVRLEPSTDAEIYRTMYIGEAAVRTGISEEWSRIRYNGEEYFVASAYLSLEPVIADTLSGRVDQLLPAMAVAAETDQLVLAVGQNDGGDRCTVFYYTKDADGNWNKRFETEGFWGFNGVKEVILEADGCTPIGCFPFRFAYGINEDPGSVMEYKQATPTAYMVDDVNSKYYNLWVDTEDEGVVVDWKTAEHVIEFPTSYNYGLFIDNNPTCDTTQGSSVICIHCTSPRGFSPGCINIAQEHILTLVTELDYTSRIVIVYGVEDLVGY